MRLGKVTKLDNIVRHHQASHKKSRNLVAEGSYSYREIDYYLKIGFERFPVLKKQMQAFTDGVEYRVYITPRSRQILSAELLKEEDLDGFSERYFMAQKKRNFRGMRLRYVRTF